MKIHDANFGLRRWAVAGTVLLLGASCVLGQGAEGVSIPLYVGNVAPLQDEFGRPMRGSPEAAAATLRPRIEIRQAFFHPWFQIYTNLAPGIHGESSPYNPLVATNLQFGMGQNAKAANSGLFCAVFPERPEAGTRIFARVFNAPNPAEATFYADSDVVEVTSIDAAVTVRFGPMKPLDAADSDGDGLANSWEALLGIDDRATADYDNDGMSDLHEMLAGTAADDATSKLAFRQIRGEPSAQVLAEGETPPRAMRVKWQSVPGKRYQLQYVMTPLGEQVFIDVGEVVAAGEGDYEIDMLVELPADALTGTFRVKLVRE